MRVITLAGALCILVQGAYALESLWVGLEAYRVLEPLCPTETRQALGNISVSFLDEPIGIIRKRETEFTARVKTNGDLEAADKALSAYLASIHNQVRDGVAAIGCAKAMTRLGLLSAKPLTFEQIMNGARNAPLPTTERSEAIPEKERIATRAAYPLQRILLKTATEGKACDNSSVKVTLINDKPLDAQNAPPFVGT